MVRGVMCDVGRIRGKEYTPLGSRTNKDVDAQRPTVLKGVIQTNALEIEQGENGSEYGRT